MRLYKIVWRTTEYGESSVKAKDKTEARKKALRGEDEDFERLDSCGDWDIYEVIDVKKKNEEDDKNFRKNILGFVKAIP